MNTKILQPVLHRYTCIADFNRNAVFFYCLAVVMVMDNPNSYARPIKHLEKGMDFGVSSNCFLVSTIISSKGIMINAVVEGKL